MPTADPAVRLLIELLGPAPNPQRLRSLLEETDWAVLYRLASRHRMIGIAAPLLSPLVDGELPDRPECPWRSRWQQLIVKDLTRLAALEEILLKASSRGLKPILLKGLSVQIQGSPEQTARECADVDLLVEPSRAREMVSCLEAMGFSFTGQGGGQRPVKDWSLLMERFPEAAFHRPSDDVLVDLHWQLRTPDGEKQMGIRSFGPLLERTREIPFGGTACAVLGREEELLLLCWRMLLGEKFKLDHLWDITQVLNASPLIDWNTLLDLAQKTGIGSYAYYALTVANQVHPWVPARTLQGLSRYRGPEPLLRPWLQLDRLILNQGQEPANLAIRWQGLRFTARPLPWLYEIFHRLILWPTRRLLGWSIMRRQGD